MKLLKTYKMKVVVTFLVIAFVSFSCDKDFLVKDNPNQIITKNFYKTQNDAILAVNSVYAVLQHHDLFKQAYWFILDGMDDHRGWRLYEDAINDVMFDFTFSPQLARSNTMWNAMYRGIFRANLVINNVSKMKDFDLKKRVLGEAHFLRGWFYNELANMWGGAPIILEQIKVSDKYNFPKATREKVYAQAEADFKFAEANLPLKSKYAASDAGRATSGAASAYLGKSYLFQKKWEKAVAQFDKVIKSGEYQLTKKFADNFSAATENNSESVFEIQFSGAGSALWSDDESSSAEHNFRAIQYGVWVHTGGMLKWLRNIYFGPRWAGFGPRRKATFEIIINEKDKKEDDGKKIKKYVEFNTDINRKSDVNLRDMRYSDVLLMYAEALNESGKTTEAIKQIDIVIDRVRKEAGLKNPWDFTGATELKTVKQLIAGKHKKWPLFITGNDQDGIRNVIKHQRSIEFAHEWKRYKDLVRWGDAPDAIVHTIGKKPNEKEIKPFKKGKHELFPIPQAEIDGNAGMTNADQNPGY